MPQAQTLTGFTFLIKGREIETRFCNIYLARVIVMFNIFVVCL
jgi:hypothetical protein